MSALFTALYEGEDKESLVSMVCDLREENKDLRAIVKAYEEGVEATLEVIHAIKETGAPGPQVYRWGWQDACEKIEEAIRNNAIGGGDGIVREMALAPEVKGGIGP